MSGKALTRLAIAALLSLGAYGRNAMTSSEEMQVVHPKFRGASNPMIAELKTKMQKVSPTILATSLWDTEVAKCAAGEVAVYECGKNGAPVCVVKAHPCLTSPAPNQSCLELQKTKIPTQCRDLKMPPTSANEGEACEERLEAMCCDAYDQASHLC